MKAAAGMGQLFVGTARLTMSCAGSTKAGLPKDEPVLLGDVLRQVAAFLGRDEAEVCPNYSCLICIQDDRGNLLFAGVASGSVHC